MADPANVRSYIMASTQHSPAALPLPAAAPFGVCTQQPNPNPHVWTMRALLTALTAWVVDDKRPPASALPRIADATLVPADQVRFPVVPAVGYGGVQRPALRFTGSTNPLHVHDRGPQCRAGETAGIETVVPPKVGSASYGVLVPQVDADGNDLAGIRSLFVQVPIGTCTGWNSYRADWFDGGPCTLVGSFTPFAATRTEREAAGDPPPSLAERYPDKAAYVNAMRIAADRWWPRASCCPMTPTGSSPRPSRKAFVPRRNVNRSRLEAEPTASASTSCRHVALASSRSPGRPSRKETAHGTT